MRSPLFIILLLCAAPALGQVPPIEPDTTTWTVDTSQVTDSGMHIYRARDTTLFRPDIDTALAGRVTDTIDYEGRLKQNPTIALFKSMVVPGWGQVGNGKYLKAAIFAGFQTWFVASAIHYGGQAADFRDQWEAAETPAARNAYYDLYENRRDQRNKFTWFAGITSFVAMFDAYVDAHLSGSPEKRQEPDRMSFDVVPDGSGGAQAMLTWTF
ncbi:hypothetical protein GF420_01020 [candidate division GN15 bacterium]|nr:hypothetical protein [candidate division GN15 bacterium]